MRLTHYLPYHLGSRCNLRAVENVIITRVITFVIFKQDLNSILFLGITTKVKTC